MNRRAFVKDTTLAAGLVAAMPWSNFARSAESSEGPVWDLHVHRAPNFSINQILELGRQRKVRFGVLEHPAPGPIKNDADLRRYVNIRLAKAQGLKFTFGSDSRNNNAGRLSYCKRIAAKCELGPEDFYLPAHKTDS